MKIAFGEQQTINWNEAADRAKGGAVGGAVFGGITGLARDAGTISGAVSAELAGLTPRLATTLEDVGGEGHVPVGGVGDGHR